ncbi:hypothetical protein LEMLEM_LOCUS18704, partial [Lemmus lemmus]
MQNVEENSPLRTHDGEENTGLCQHAICRDECAWKHAAHMLEKLLS